MNSQLPEILPHSPLDEEAVTEPAQAPPAEQLRFVPSRFNAHARLPDGSTVVWNSYSGAINVFAAEQKRALDCALSHSGFRGPLRGLTRYLYQRGFIVAAKTDEDRRTELLVARQHYRSDALELILLASEDCNFRCRYCYESFARGTMAPAVRLGIRQWITQKLPELKQLTIGWFGGEPLYGFAAVADLAPFFLKAARDHGITYSSSITTNGFLLSPDIVDQLLSWNITGFQITLDGIEHVHDSKRFTREGRGTFATILQHLVALRNRKENLQVILRVNFDAENRFHLRELLQFLELHFGGDPRFAVALHPVGCWGGPNDSSLRVCASQDISAVRADLAAVAGKLKTKSLLSSARPGEQVCYAGRPYSFVVGAHGKLMKCSVVLDREEFNIVGQVLPHGEPFIDFGKLAAWIDLPTAHPRCRKCFMLPSCQGMHCPLVRIQTHHPPCPEPRKRIRTELLRAAM